MNERDAQRPERRLARLQREAGAFLRLGESLRLRSRRREFGVGDAPRRRRRSPRASERVRGGVSPRLGLVRVDQGVHQGVKRGPPGLRQRPRQILNRSRLGASCVAVRIVVRIVTGRRRRDGRRNGRRRRPVTRRREERVRARLPERGGTRPRLLRGPIDGGNARDAIRASSFRRLPLRIFVPPERSRRLPAPPAPSRRDVVSHRPKQPRPLLDRLQRGEDLAARERLFQLVSQFGRPPGVSRRDAVVADEIVGAAATAEGAEGAVDPSVGHRARRSDRALFRAPQSRRRLVLVLVGVVLMRSRVRHEGLDHVRRDLHHLAQLANLPLKPGDLAADPDERLVVREDVLPLLGLGEIAQRRELVAQMPHAPLGGVAVELRGETVEVEILRVILGPRVEGLAQLGHRSRGHRGRLCGHR